MMCLRKGWIDGWMGCKVLHILSLECSNFLEKNLKNATWDGLRLSKFFFYKLNIFCEFLVLMAKGPRQFLTSFLKVVQKMDQEYLKSGKKGKKGCFLEILKIIIYLDMLFMNF